ncbi:hypothetical protein [Pontibacter actiniarum]|uniref:DNA-binding protein n=1 Tax=Pontibacter actiniarum TaxID=323450 RepID=A0A1X9YVA0_9BACT|nr:hypothetical protein [Pontibacter actiniarum]ARS36808.1 hypothetical protein CA264_16030 [Pontibacter actiniarum]
MKLHHITPNGIYQISGADLLNLIDYVMEQSIEKAMERIKEKGPKPIPDRWLGKRKLTTDEAAEFLGIKKLTLYDFHKKYSMTYEKSRPNMYTIEELERVERERRIRPH